MRLRGREARVVFEVELRGGAVLRIPLSDATLEVDRFSSLGELRIPVSRSLLEGWHSIIRESERDFGDRV